MNDNRQQIRRIGCLFIYEGYLDRGKSFRSFLLVNASGLCLHMLKNITYHILCMHQLDTIEDNMNEYIAYESDYAIIQDRKGGA